MKTVLFTVILLLAILSSAQQNVGGATAKGPTSDTKMLTRSELEELLAKPNEILIIDVRRPDEIKDIGGFPVYLNVQIGELEKSLAWIPRERKIITVSNHAARAGRAADLLAAHGFQVVGTVGAQTYEEQGGKLTKISPPSPATSEKKAP